MREIKFRVFYKPEICMKQVHSIDAHNRFVYWFDEGNREKQSCHYSLDGKYGDALLMQYTGMKDKNGTEIYEGDILYFIPYETNTNNRVVKFKDGQFIGELIRNNHCTPLKSVYEGTKVIGNIYENPELLEGSL